MFCLVKDKCVNRKCPQAECGTSGSPGRIPFANLFQTEGDIGGYNPYEVLCESGERRTICRPECLGH